MKYEIKGDAEKIVKVLPPFIKEVEEEYEKVTTEAQRKLNSVLKRTPIPNAGVVFPILTFSFYKEDNNTVILMNTFPAEPKGKILKGLLKPITYKLKRSTKDLEEFFKSEGIEAKVKYIGD